MARGRYIHRVGIASRGIKIETGRQVVFGEYFKIWNKKKGNPVEIRPKCEPMTGLANTTASD